MSTGDTRPAELVRVRRRAIHALLDAAMTMLAFVLAIVWATQGHDREAMILLMVAYWGGEWRERTDG